MVCANSLTVPRKGLEERIFGALREGILVPESVAYAVEKKAVARQKVEAEPQPSAAERARLAERRRRPAAEARVLEMREAFEADPGSRRRAFRALLGDRRMRVLPDPERRFRVEGLFELTLPETTDARPLQAAGRRVSVVAGARKGPVGAAAIPETWHRLAA